VSRKDQLRVFCAIDTRDIDLGISIADEVRDHVRGVKLGLEFFGTYGPSGVRRFLDAGLSVFLDLKFFDIPNTVSGAVAAVAQCQPAMITIHAGGGSDMMKAAVDSNQEEAAKLGITPPLLLGVTVLTSFGNKDLASAGVAGNIHDQVLRLAKLSESSGLDGVVCSAHELGRLRAVCDVDFKLIVPGIRPRGVKPNDQKRIMTPSEAIREGADFLVVGRPITQAADLSQAARDISSEVQEALDL
jgi:orotidine-5'-phosphate decarboxylase